MDTNILTKSTYNNQEILTPQVALDEIIRQYKINCKIPDVQVVYDKNFKESELFKQITTFPIKGILKKNAKSENWNKVVYCELVDAQTKVGLKIIINKYLHDSLNDNTECLFNGYYVGCHTTSTSDIPIRFNVTELIDSNAFFSKDRAVVAELLTLNSDTQRKHVNITDFICSNIESKIISHNINRLKIGLLVPIENEIKDDIEGGIDKFEHTRKYVDINYINVNITSLSDILDKLNEIDNKDYDIIGISRGGISKNGPDSEIFNNSKLCHCVANLKTPFITAIAHTRNKFCLEPFADKNYYLPKDLGVNLSEIIKTCINKRNLMEKYKALEIKLGTIDLEKKNYAKEIEIQLYNKFESELAELNLLQQAKDSTYKNKIDNLEKEHNSNIKDLKKEVDELKTEIKKKDSQILNYDSYRHRYRDLEIELQRSRQEKIKFLNKLKLTARIVAASISIILLIIIMPMIFNLVK